MGVGAAVGKFAAKPIIVEALVADQRADGDAIEQRLNADAVMPLARQEDETRQIDQRARIDSRGLSSVAFNGSALDCRSSPPAAARKALSPDRRRQGQSLRCRAAPLAMQAEPR